MPGGGDGASTALRTDHYELTMLAAARRSGVASHRSVFEVFARSLPKDRRYGVVGGTGRIAEAVAAFRFDDVQLAFLADRSVVDPATLTWLAEYRFGGSITGYAEGETYFPGSPICSVEGTFAQAIVLETIVLSILNHDAAVASAAARMDTVAARAARLIDMGTRRTHEDAAVHAARAAYVAGFDATSNLEAGRRYGIPTVGTAAHAYTMAHASERDAFLAQLQTLGTDTTLLVDTYDTDEGIRTAVAAARELGVDSPGAIRIDSGDLAIETRRARALLDELGASRTRIVISGDLDEHEIERLERNPHGRAPIDAYGIGTRLVTGSGHPTAGFVYKLVAIADRPGAAEQLVPVAKRSVGKATQGGWKSSWRVRDAHGTAISEVISLDGKIPDGARPLQTTLVRDGEETDGRSLDEMRAHHLMARDELPRDALALTTGSPALRASFDPAPTRTTEPTRMRR